MRVPPEDFVITPDAPPRISAKLRTLAKQMVDYVAKTVDLYLATEQLVQAESIYTHNTVPTLKKDTPSTGLIRLAVDFSVGLNKFLVPISNYVTSVQHVLDSLDQGLETCVTEADVEKSYHQVPITSRSQALSGIVVSLPHGIGTFRPTSLQEGISCASQMLARALAYVFCHDWPLSERKGVSTIQDGVVAVHGDVEEHAHDRRFVYFFVLVSYLIRDVLFYFIFNTHGCIQRICISFLLYLLGWKSFFYYYSYFARPNFGMMCMPA